MEQIDDLVSVATYNEVNELVSQQAAGAMRFAGTVNEPATVTVAGVRAIVGTTNDFQASVPVVAGTNTVSITARDASGNTTTQQFQLTNTATSKTFTYDANGNLTSDGTRSFEWDARNELLGMSSDGARMEFAYDGVQRRIRQVEKENGETISDTGFIWCHMQLCEERTSTGTIQRRIFAEGEDIDGVPRFLFTDHLNSVTDVTDATAVRIAEYVFDPWGRRTLQAGADATTIAYGGYQKVVSGMLLTLFRVYDPDLGRWLSEDPLGLSALGGPNLYEYVADQPTNLVDPLGLQWLPPSKPPSALPPSPPNAPGCVGGFGGMMVCNPPAGPKMCARPPRRPCTPYTDWWLFTSCMLFQGTGFMTWVPAPGGGSGSLIMLTAGCKVYATRCREGGPPPTFPDVSLK